MKRFWILLSISTIFAVGYGFYDIHKKYADLERDIESSKKDFAGLANYIMETNNETKDAFDSIESRVKSYVSRNCKTESSYVSGTVEKKYDVIKGNYLTFNDWVGNLSISCN